MILLKLEEVLEKCGVGSFMYWGNLGYYKIIMGGGGLFSSKFLFGFVMEK